MENTSNGAKNMEVTTLAGGCFWCLEAVYLELKGVEKVVSGYANGRVPNPTYKEVCSGRTGHAEVVQITYDPAVISFADLLDVFFTIHDPTTLNRQGADVGTQYRSGIYYHNEEQHRIAEDKIRQLEAEGLWKIPSSPKWRRWIVSTPAKTITRTTSPATRCNRTARWWSRQRLRKRVRSSFNACA
ncbi:MAG: peptide-methionine (S)-S-oxide reductase MsrA [Caldilineaceae bacterium]